MLTVPATNKELFDEIDKWVNELPQPINQLFLLEVYKLYMNHKLEYTTNVIINDFAAATQTNL